MNHLFGGFGTEEEEKEKDREEKEKEKRGDFFIRRKSPSSYQKFWGIKDAIALVSLSFRHENKIVFVLGHLQSIENLRSHSKSVLVEFIPKCDQYSNVLVSSS